MKIYNTIQNGDTIMHFLNQYLKKKQKQWTIKTQKYHEWNFVDLRYKCFVYNNNVCNSMT